ncbi:PTS sugar transporter subunit IIB [Lactobacillus sp. YT155]|uniref:PTS system mannose/fructose/N-acetylgalactosamine-transporter subunit IIB n=1 Tax=Lactobacillus sp. YT155 TaxID=3060955 RepID=UPI00265FC5BD|nr:PTS sugar transporter subunit IIB [Lactobacillus sp. YT155]MDO1604937.1 PTS sugar transporter subunit IIB [Lactobacillus sp. YT155]
MSQESLGIKNIRIDERLIHGQVATMWTNSLKATRIMVVDDEVVKNDIEKMALKTAVPSGIKLSILTAKGAAERIMNGNYEEQRVFLLTKSPKPLVDLVKNGVPIEKVNVGNMSSKENSKQVKKSVSVTPSDIDNFKILDEAGVELVAQMVPTEDPVNFMKLMEE